MGDVGPPWAVIQHVAYEGPGLIADSLDRRRLPVTVIRADLGHALPDPDDLAGLVGSPIRHDMGIDLELPDPAFASGVRARCDRRGAVLILDRFAEYRAKFVKVMPHEYRRALGEIEAAARAHETRPAAEARAEGVLNG